MVECSYVVEKSTGKVINFNVLLTAYKDTSVLQKMNREQVMKDYIRYLQLDVLDDWEFNGNRYYSKKADLYVDFQDDNSQGYCSMGLQKS